MGFIRPEYSDLAGLDPQILLMIEGQIIGEEWDLGDLIQSFSFTESEEEKDVMELTIWDQEMRFSNHPLLQSGNIVTAQWGYRGNLSSIIRCMIKDIEPSFPSSGKPTVKIRALDESCQMSGIKHARGWKNPDPDPTIELPGIAYSEIAALIADMYGFGKEIYPSFNMGWAGNKGRWKMVPQFNESDSVFLERLARIAQWGPERGQTGFVFYVEGTGGGSSILHFHPQWWQAEEPEQFLLEYYSDPGRGSLLDFSPRLNAESAKGAGTQVMCREFDPRRSPLIIPDSDGIVENRANNDTTEAKEIHGKYTNIAPNAAGMASWNEQNDLGEQIFTASSHDAPIPWADEDEVKENMRLETEGVYLEAIQDESDAEGETIGIPRMRAKRKVYIEGLPGKYVGIYHIVECTHKIIPGYRCHLKLKKIGQEKIEAKDKTVKLKGRSYGVSGSW